MSKIIFLIFTALVFCSFGHGQENVTIVGQILHSKSDTVKIILSVNEVVRKSITISVPLVNGRFSQAISIDKVSFLCIVDGSNYIHAILEPGDDLAISCDANNVKASLKYNGKASEQCQLLQSFIDFNLPEKLKAQTASARLSKFPFDYN